MMSHGPESWHPNPEFFYDLGGGPLFDMGPYYITALVRLLGRGDSVFAYGTKAFEERTAGHKDKSGQKIPVKVDTHHAGLIHFENGIVATLVTSFDVWKHNMPHIEIYGTEGTLSVPDPNLFSGIVRLYTTQSRTFTDIPLLTPYTENSRGIGLSEIILAINENRNNNASGALALHVLEIMEGFVRSAKEGQMIRLESSPSKSIAMDWTINTGELRTK